MFRSFTLFLAIVSCLVTARSFGQYQQKTIDSLLAINKAYTKSDTVKVLLLDKISRGLVTTRSPADALVYAQQGLALAEAINSKKYIGNIDLSIGAVLALQTKYAGSIQYNERALTIFKELKNVRQYSAALYNIGNDYKFLNEYNKALDYYLKSNESIKALKDPSEEVASILQIASTYLDLDKKDKALEYNYMALKIAEKDNDRRQIANSYFNIANVQYNIANYNEAINYYKKAQAIKHELNEKRSEALITYDMANAYFNIENYTASSENFNKSLALAKLLGNRALEIGSIEGLAGIYEKQGKYDEALQSYTNVLTARKMVGDQKMVGYAYTELAQVYTETGKYDLAEQQLKEAEVIFNKLKSSAGLKDTYDQYTKLYETSHNYAKALSSYRSFIAVRDSLVNVDIKNQVEKRELQYNFDKKESEYQLNAKITSQNLEQQKILAVQRQQQLSLSTKELALSNKEKSLQRLKFLTEQAHLENARNLQQAQMQKTALQVKLDKQLTDQQLFKQQQDIKGGNRQRLFLLFVVVAILLVAALIFYNQLKTRRLNKVITLQKQDLETLNGVKDRIFSVISHDLRSPVNTLASYNQLLNADALTEEKKKRYAVEMQNALDSTSVLLENLLNWSKSQLSGYKPAPEVYSLTEIAEEALDYIADRASQKKILLRNNISGDTKVFADRNMTELILRNIIANAVKYTKENGVVELYTETNGANTVLAINDTGIGMDDKTVASLNASKPGQTNSRLGTDKERGSGLGIMLSRSFAEIMNGNITVKSEPGKGSTFFVTIPSAA